MSPIHVTTNGTSSSDPLFLGLDLSTQQLKAVLLSSSGSILPNREVAINFDRDLPHYGTKNGAVFGPGLGEVTSPVGMWVEAMDILFGRMQKAGWEVGRVRGISGSGQVRSISFIVSLSSSYADGLSV
jgi:xylulokinase